MSLLLSLMMSRRLWLQDHNLGLLLKEIATNAWGIILIFDEIFFDKIYETIYHDSLNN